jgi:Cdc6-like AAA superfamily ATPase
MPENYSQVYLHNTFFRQNHREKPFMRILTPGSSWKPFHFLIGGDSGSGKTVLSEAVHQMLYELKLVVEKKPQVINAIQLLAKPELLTDCSIEVQGEFGHFRVTTIERTLVDCFKYRNKIGLSIFLEAARMAHSKINPAGLHDEAERLRVLNNILPYLKSYFS